MPLHVERPQITEIQVRMDCNGCVQKIRRALQTIHGIYDVVIDFPQQKVTVVGWADPDKVMKAIKKAGKKAKLCSHTIDEEPLPPENPPPEAAEAPDTGADAPPAEQPPPEGGDCGGGCEPPPPPEDAPPADAPPPEDAPQAPVGEAAGADPPPLEPPPPAPGRIIDYTSHYPEVYNYAYTTHSPPPPVSQFHKRLPRPPGEANYYLYNNSNINYYHCGSAHVGYPTATPRQSLPYNNGSDGNISSMFSDENPNACCIS
eukprot:TRINITY_DN37812_c0_g1_i1.p2 TRINITY_DN37812_c0_g1~~TRINITY_DN37812_c0_g1_i1.p2  ORF type:complete len:259 (-),score=23.04 TRINITY_DN37812_c0_g1_i1:230-1006(-)